MLLPLFLIKLSLSLSLSLSLTHSLTLSLSLITYLALPLAQQFVDRKFCPRKHVDLGDDNVDMSVRVTRQDLVVPDPLEEYLVVLVLRTSREAVTGV